MKKKLEKSIVLSLLLSSSVCSFVFAEDVNLVQRNLHFINDYKKIINGSLDIELTTTGASFNNSSNYDKSNFAPNEGAETGYNVQVGKALVLWDNSQLEVNTDVDISIKPEAWGKYNKIEMERVGIELIENTDLHVQGNTEILVQNYKYTNNDDELKFEPDEDYGMDSQKGLVIEDSAHAQFDGNLDITMSNGNRSTGILASGTKASLTVKGDTDITVKNAPYYTYGISNQYADQSYGFNYRAEDADLNFNNLSITTVGGNNSVGINLKDSNRNAAGKNSITVNGHLNLDVSGAQYFVDRTTSQNFPNSVSNYGMYFYYITDAKFNTAKIKTTAAGDGVESIGTYLHWFSNATFEGDVEYITTAEDKDVEISALARAGSNLEFQKGLKANAAVVLNAVGKASGSGSTIKVNSTADKSADVQLNGNIVVGKTSTAYIFGSKYETMVDADSTKNVISANLLNKNSYFTGINEFGNESGFDASQSTINLNFADGAKWNMTDSSPVTALDLANSAVVDMTYANTDAGSGFRELIAKSISGKDGIINMNIDASTNTGNSDRVYVDGTHSGTHYITLNNIDKSGVYDAAGTVLVSVNDEQGEFLAKPDEGTLYWNKYTLDRLDTKDGEDVTDGYNTDWILAEVEQTDEPTTSVDTILGANALNYHTWIMESDKLMKRMGDLRHNGADEQGAWFRVRGSKISRDDSAAFENKYTTYELGYDVLDEETKDYKRYAGAAISYSDGSSSYESGSGENSGKAISFYSTTMRNKGHYLDFVFKVVDMDNDFSVYDTNGNNITGAMDNQGISLNVEYGRKKDLGNKWYIEPQGQLTFGYLGGDQYKLNNGIAVDQGGVSSLVGRVGFNIGRDVDEKTNLYFKANLLHEFLGDYSLDMTDTATGDTLHKEGSFGDTWGEIGIGAAIQTGKNNHIYFDVEKTFGGDFTKDWGWNAGMRWTF